MKNLFLLLLCSIIQSNIGYSQYKKNDLSYDMHTINKKNNKGKQGTWVFYYLDSTDIVKENFVNDTLNGDFERYYQNGKINEKGFCKNGVFDSTHIFYWKNGVKLQVFNYKNGNLDGEVMRFDSTGKLTAHFAYVKGDIDTSKKGTFIDGGIWADNIPKNNGIDTANMRHLRNWVYNVPNNRGIDTVKTIYSPGESKWNKEYAILRNDTLIKHIIFYNNVVRIEDFFEMNVNTKRIVYFKNKPHSIENIFYYKDGQLSRTELYDKKGKLTKIH